MTWLLFQGDAPALHFQDFGDSYLERKISGSVPDVSLPGQLYHTGGMLSMPLLPQLLPGKLLATQSATDHES